MVNMNIFVKMCLLFTKYGLKDQGVFMASQDVLILGYFILSAYFFTKPNKKGSSELTLKPLLSVG